MSIQLPVAVEAIIQSRVDSGEFETAAEVVVEALRLLDRRDAEQQLLAIVGRSREQFRNGEYAELTPELWDDIDRNADEADRLGLPLRRDFTA